MTVELIVYACPTGQLADELAEYFRAAAGRFGENAAHAYPPHVTLTGFFHVDAAALPATVAALDRAVLDLRPAPEDAVRVWEVLFQPDFHGLLIAAPWPAAVATRFAALHAAADQPEAIRLKHDLHLSLAYEFAAADHDGLQALAMELVGPRSPAAWELRLYERRPDRQWFAHAVWAVEHRCDT
jgi:ubiquitin-associated SH3 domain-containing protein